MRRGIGAGLGVVAVVAAATLVRGPATIAPPPAPPPPTPDATAEDDAPDVPLGGYLVQPIAARSLVDLDTPPTVVRSWTAAAARDVVALVAPDPGRRGRLLVSERGGRLRTRATVPEEGVAWLGIGGRATRVAWWTPDAVAWVDVGSGDRDRTELPAGLEVLDAAVLWDGRIAGVALRRDDDVPVRLVVVDPDDRGAVAEHALAGVPSTRTAAGGVPLLGTAWSLDRLLLLDPTQQRLTAWSLGNGTLIEGVDLGSELGGPGGTSAQLALHGRRLYAAGSGGRSGGGLAVLAYPGLDVRGAVDAPVVAVRASAAGSRALAQVDDGSALLVGIHDATGEPLSTAPVLGGRPLEVLGFAGHDRAAYLLERGPGRDVLHAVDALDGSTIAQRALPLGVRVLVEGPVLGVPAR